ncbi:MAG: hypothetical protein FWB77_02515 [Treponema sp.]|nr:hypothetical protein [Treponema sp.]
MRKARFFIILIFIFQTYSCTIPKEVEVRSALPALKYSAGLNVNEMLLDMIGEALGDGMDISILDYTADDIQTFLIHLNAVEAVFKLEDVLDEFVVSLLKNTGGMWFLTPQFLFDLNELGMDPIILPLSNIGEILGNLKFDPAGIEAKIYFKSNDPFIEDLYVFMEFIEVDEDGIEVNPENPLSTLSIPAALEFLPTKLELSEGDIIDLANNEYNDNKLPDGGIEIINFAKLLNAKKDISVKLEVSIQPRITIAPYKLSDELSISADVVIKLPLKLNASAGSEFVLPLPDDFLADAGDYIVVFTDVLESLSVSAGMTPANPFNGTSLIIRQPGTRIEIMNPLTSNSLDFSISAADMEKIRGVGNNLNPVISLGFPRDMSIEILRDFCITTITLQANISYLLDLSGE